MRVGSSPAVAIGERYATAPMTDASDLAAVIAFVESARPAGLPPRDPYGDGPCSVIGLRHDHDMALTALLDVKQSPVRRFMERELPATAPVCKEANASVRAGRSGDPPGAPGPGVDGGLVGTAVEYVLPIPHGSVRKPQLAGAPTPELADRRLEAAELAVAELRRLGGLAEPLSGPALERAADCALVCARLEQRFRIGDNRGYELRLPDPAVGVGVVGGLDGAIEAALASAETRADLVALLEAGLTDTADLYSADALAIDPSFALRTRITMKVVGL